MSVAWDATLGGQAFSSQVADIMKAKSKQDPSKNPRAMAKLLASAEKTKVPFTLPLPLPLPLSLPSIKKQSFT